MVFAFEKGYDILLYGGGPLVYLNLGFGASVTLEYAIVSEEAQYCCNNVLVVLVSHF